MRTSIWLTVITALAALAVVLIIGQIIIIRPDRALITYARFSLAAISPNADNDSDVTEFTYEVTRSSYVSLFFESEDGTQYIFRENEPRQADEYTVLFSGVVDGFVLPGEEIAGEVRRRLIPNGMYSWTFRAQAQDNAEVMELHGTLRVEEADSPLPEITVFTVGPEVFTPNQDGVNDRTMINVFLTKAADLSVYLVSETNERLFIARREEGREAGEAGRHVFDYEGGVDIGADPPPDGVYTVVARAQDAEGQVIERTASLTIADGGKPRAEIIPQPVGVDVVFAVMPYDEQYFSTIADPGALIPMPEDPQSLSRTAITLPLGDMLVFKLTVFNYGPTPIRTTGPWPGTVYQQTQLTSSLGFYEQSGAWRVGIQCETSAESYPWRWAVGLPEDLEVEVDPANGNIYYYLPPGGRAVVWGGVRMTELLETRNPQDCWAGLIHEDVEISLQNSNVGRREVELADTSSGTGE